MKRIHILFWAVLITNCGYGQIFPGQKTLNQIAKNYFRSNPFEKEFSDFMNHLLNDPTIVNKFILKRTDTSLFYMSGDYTTHHPFFFKPTKTKVVVAESEFIINDSLSQTDTIITYQLAGYTPGGNEGETDVKKEFEKFDRKYIKKFKETTYTEIKNGKDVTGAIRNYFIFINAPATLSIAWLRMDAVKENVFVITLRFKVTDNMTVIPVYDKMQ